jgi:hypothetical protein
MNKKTKTSRDLFGYIGFNPVRDDLYNTKIMIYTTKDRDLFQVDN